jgi:hypothetical protein
MRALAVVAVFLACTIAARGIARVHQPDFSGRWRFVAPTAAQLANETLTMAAPDERLVEQTSRQIATRTYMKVAP